MKFTDNQLEMLELATAMGIKVKHFIPPYNNNGGITVAYYRPKNHKIIELSVAICNKKEQYSKRMGRITAIDKFLQSHTIQLPIDPKDNTVDYLNNRFGDYVEEIF